MSKCRSWTKAEMTTLKKEYPSIKDPRLLATRLNRSYHAIKTKALLLGLKRELFANSPWTPAKEQKLIQLYPNHTNAVIARRLKLKVTQIDPKAFKLGLKKDKEFAYMCTMKSAFKKGSVPANKGQKMPKHVYKKAKATMFKKGNLPKNTLHDGAITIRHNHKDRGERPYKWIRISMGVWKQLHVFTWEQKNGPVPQGHLVVFKDGDTLNCKLSNLELISRAENMKRNSGSKNLSDGVVASYIVGKNYPHLREEVLKHPQLIEAKRKQLQLNRVINGKINKKPRKAV